MTLEHRSIQEWILSEYGSKYEVHAETQARNTLSLSEGSMYCPDVLIFTRRGKLKYIVEIEGRPTRKALAGACILADLSVKSIPRVANVALIFVVYHASGIRQIDNYRIRVKLLDRYIQNLRSILVMPASQFKRARL